MGNGKLMKTNGINRMSRRAHESVARVDLDRPIDQGPGLIRASRGILRKKTF
jgi:hypothetical protein